MIEEWRPVLGFERHYCVSNYGRVKSENRSAMVADGRNVSYKGKVISQKKNKGGYMQVELCKAGARYHFLAHRLVAAMFCENPFNLKIVNHIDFDRQNNIPENLEWVTTKENANHSAMHGHMGRRKSKLHGRKLNREQVKEIISLRSRGHPWSDIARKYSTTGNTVKAAVKAETQRY